MRFKLNQAPRWALATCVAAVLSACGGGGGSPSNAALPGGSGPTVGATSPAGLLVATFIDAPVAGLEYSANSASGVTDDLGNFEYAQGETVTFSVGNVVLGSAKPDGDVVRPVHLVAGASSDTDVRVTRILQTLQSLDDNADPEDGIRISRATREHMRSSTSGAVHLDDSTTTDDEVEQTLPAGTFTVTPDEAVQHADRHKDDASNANQGYTPPAASTAPVAQPLTTNGRLLASNCFQCHGTGGTGGFDRIRGGEAGEVFEYTGRVAASSIMAAHAQGFTRAQLDAIVSYLNQ